MIRSESACLEKTLIASIVLLLLANLATETSLIHGYDYSRTFVLTAPDSSKYELAVTVPSSLYYYYQAKVHRISSWSDYAKFVTPYSLAPIASELKTIYKSDEDFANGVLSILHHFTYKERAASYPVETLVDGWGDCDSLSYLAASILRAGGVDVILLIWKDVKHMNIGVCLRYSPAAPSLFVSYYTYQGNRYYITECTGTGWYVGQIPERLALEKAVIIDTGGCEQWSPSRVSVTLSLKQRPSLAERAMSMAQSLISDVLQALIWIFKTLLKFFGF